MSIIEEIESYVKEVLGSDKTGHDWHHVDRVRNLALQIAESEGADKYLVELAALLHDVDDYKLGGGTKAENFLTNKVSEDVKNQVLQIIKEVSFKGANVEDSVSSLESACVQDADRLDAMGAMGISRAFIYGGRHEFPMHDPEIKPKMHESFEEYKKQENTILNHFYEKLLLLKGRMKTGEGKRLAEKRHEFMERFVRTFLEEWH